MSNHEQLGCQMSFIKNEEKTLMTLKEAIIRDKIAGLSDIEIGKKYKITYRELERIIRESAGVK